MARSKMSDLDKLKKYGSDPSKGKQFAKLWDKASDSDRNAYRNYSVRKIYAYLENSRPNTTLQKKVRNQMKASKKRSAGGKGA